MNISGSESDCDWFESDYDLLESYCNWLESHCDWWERGSSSDLELGEVRDVHGQADLHAPVRGGRDLRPSARVSELPDPNPKPEPRPYPSLKPSIFNTTPRPSVYLSWP